MAERGVRSEGVTRAGDVTVRHAARRYWTERLPVRRWVFVVLWAVITLNALNTIAKWVAHV